MPSAAVYISFWVSPKASSDLLFSARRFACAGLLRFVEGPRNTSVIAIATWSKTGWFRSAGTAMKNTEMKVKAILPEQRPYSKIRASCICSAGANSFSSDFPHLPCKEKGKAVEMRVWRMLIPSITAGSAVLPDLDSGKRHLGVLSPISLLSSPTSDILCSKHPTAMRIIKAVQICKVDSSAQVNQRVWKSPFDNSDFIHTPTFKSAASSEVGYFLAEPNMVFNIFH